MKLNPWIGVTNMEVCSELGLHFTYSKVSHLFEKKKKDIHTTWIMYAKLWN